MGSSVASDEFTGVGEILPNGAIPLSTGAMLSRLVLLTDAQAVFRDPDPSHYQFTLGAGITAHATEIRFHPQFLPSGEFNVNLTFDIALVKLDETDVQKWPVFSQYAISDVLTPLGAIATGVGFGNNAAGSGSGVKRSGAFSVTNYLDGANDIGVPVSNAFFEATSASAVPQWIAHGDFGSPLFVDGRIAGVASFKFSTEDSAGPSDYVNVLNDAGWINQNLNEMDPSVPEPGTLTLIVTGLIGLALAWLRRPGGTAMRRGDGKTRVNNEVTRGNKAVRGRYRPIVTPVRIAALSLLVVCAHSSPASAIIMGFSTTSDQYTGVGMIPPTADHGLFTGAMVSAHVVLTAGQTVQDDQDPSHYEFTLGPGITAHATEIRVHPLFISPSGLNLAFDLALIKLDEADVQSWPVVARYAISDVVPPIGSLVTGVGFGNSAPGSGSGVKRSGTFSVNNYKAGADDSGFPIPRAFIEATSGDVVPQWIGIGDTGGPLFYENQLVGVASFRFGLEDQPGPSYYVSPLNDLGWIRENLNELDPPVPEPGTLTILASGLIFLAVARLRRRVLARCH
jgi:hypothetical protein